MATSPPQSVGQAQPPEYQVCPKCGQTIADGYLSTDQHIVVPVALVTITIGLHILYSYKCGFLRIIVQ